MERRCQVFKQELGEDKFEVLSFVNDDNIRPQQRFVLFEGSPRKLGIRNFDGSKLTRAETLKYTLIKNEAPK